MKGEVEKLRPNHGLQDDAPQASRPLPLRLAAWDSSR